MDPSTFRGSMLGMVWCSVPSQEVFGSIGLYIYTHITIITIVNYYYDYYYYYYYCYYYYYFLSLLLYIILYNQYYIIE